MKNETEKEKEGSSPYCLYGSNVLLDHVQKLDSLMGGASKNEDVEYVHKLRVTSRRIRAALSLFEECYPKKEYKRWLKEIKKVTSSLGAARDLDVQILFLKKHRMKAENADIFEAMHYLLKIMEAQRSEIQKDVVRVLQEIKDLEVLTEMKQTFERILISTKTKNNIIEWDTKTYMLAHKHIAKRLTGFQRMKVCVNKEKDVTQHHQMRIKAKKFRYTLEIFNTLYKDQLKDDITVMKTFQDLLGEMHDCDVWKDRLLGIMKEASMTPELKKSLKLFSQYMKKRRHIIYTQFVDHWNTQQEKNFSKTCLAHASVPLFISSEEHPKIAVISDVHGNLHALNAVLKDMEQEHISLFLNLGDLVGYGAYPNEVVSTLMKKNNVSISGNYDLEVVNGISKGKMDAFEKQSYTYARKNLTKQSKHYLKSLPHEQVVEINGRQLLLAHEHPIGLQKTIHHNTPVNKLKQYAKKTPMDVILTGHTHYPFTRTVEKTLFLNPGSIGRSAGKEQGASYAILHTKDFSAEHRTIPYEVTKAAESIRRQYLPEYYAQMMLTGKPLKDLVHQDVQLEQSFSSEETLASVQKIAETYDPDIKHSKQVTELALSLFDQTQSLHQLTEKDRLLLQYASLLHDIGWSKGQKGHHKSSLLLIFNEPSLPFSVKDRSLIGNIARYHRKGLPQPSHYHYMDLKPSQRKKVRLLSAILRVADGLDASHAALVKQITVQTHSKSVTIDGETTGDCRSEESSVQKKKDLFEDVFKKKLVLSWKHQP